MIKNITLAFFLLTSITLFSQTEKLNNYKYVIVPAKFDFVKITDGYSTSSLTKFLLEKKGFTVFLSNEKLPLELNTNRCLGVQATVIDNSGMFKTKSLIEFKDCNSKVVYTTGVGISKEKDYKKSYHQAIRSAFKSMSKFKYVYSIVDDNSNLVKETINTTPKVNVVTKANLINKTSVKTEPIEEKTKEILYAQPKNNGFQLVNMKPEVVFLILKTNLKDVFIIKDKNGVLYKNENTWYSEIYENNQLIKKEYLIKF